MSSKFMYPKTYYLGHSKPDELKTKQNKIVRAHSNQGKVLRQQKEKKVTKRSVKFCVWLFESISRIALDSRGSKSTVPEALPGFSTRRLCAK